MREILFRGRDKHTGKLVYGHYFTSPYAGKNGEDNTFHFISDIPSYGSHMVDPNTVGQCTGMTDIGGKKIFEGDIMETAVTGLAHHTGVVEFADGAFGLRCTDGAAFFLCFVAGSFTIIGNIHDNPELLEVGHV